jgi:hypothetical protein
VAEHDKNKGKVGRREEDQRKECDMESGLQALL